MVEPLPSGQGRNGGRCGGGGNWVANYSSLDLGFIFSLDLSKHISGLTTDPEWPWT